MACRHLERSRTTQRGLAPTAYCSRQVCTVNSGAQASRTNRRLPTANTLPRNASGSNSASGSSSGSPSSRTPPPWTARRASPLEPGQPRRDQQARQPDAAIPRGPHRGSATRERRRALTCCLCTRSNRASALGSGALAVVQIDDRAGPSGASARWGASSRRRALARPRRPLAGRSARTGAGTSRSARRGSTSACRTAHRGAR